MSRKPGINHVWVRMAETGQLEQELAEAGQEKARLEALNPHLREGAPRQDKFGALGTYLEFHYLGLSNRVRAATQELARRRALGDDPLCLDVNRRTLEFGGKVYDLTRHKPAFQAIQLLYEGWRTHTLDISDEEIKRRVGIAANSRLCDSFRGLGLWGPGKLVIRGTLKGTVRLNLPARPC